MAVKSFKPRGKGSGEAKGKLSAEEFVRKVKEEKRSKGPGYREASLKIHGWICAKCGREFEASNLHLLTVHHKDGDHLNNPPDGSNWENLCVYCHDDEHSRELLANYLDKAAPAGRPEEERKAEKSGGLGTLGDLLKDKLKNFNSE